MIENASISNRVGHFVTKTMNESRKKEKSSIKYGNKLKYSRFPIENTSKLDKTKRIQNRTEISKATIMSKHNGGRSRGKIRDNKIKESGGGQ